MKDRKLAALLCTRAHCNHAHRSRLAKLVSALTRWTVVRCCVCDRIALVRSRTPIVK